MQLHSQMPVRVHESTDNSIVYVLDLGFTSIGGFQTNSFAELTVYDKEVVDPYP